MMNTLERNREIAALPFKNAFYLGWLRANGFITQKTFEDLVKLRIIKFNGALKRILDDEENKHSA